VKKLLIIGSLFLVLAISVYIFYMEFIYVEPVYEPSPQPASTPAQPEQLKDFKPQWKEGTRYLFRFESVSDSETNMPDKPKPLTVHEKITQDVTIDVLSKRPRGGLEIEIHFFNTKLETRSNEKEIKSEYEMSMEMMFETLLGFNPSQRMPTIWEILDGLRIKYFLDSQGNVETMEGWDKFLETLYLKMEKYNPLALGMARDIISQGEMKEWVLPPRDFPKGPVSPGDKWSVIREITLTGFLRVEQRNRFLFKGWEDRNGARLAVLDITGEIKQKKSEDKSAFPAMKVTLKKGRTKGRILFDPNPGMEKDAYLIQESEMKMEYVKQSGPSLFMGKKQTAASKIQNTTSLKLIEIKELTKDPTRPSQ